VDLSSLSLKIAAEAEPNLTNLPGNNHSVKSNRNLLDKSVIAKQICQVCKLEYSDRRVKA